MVKKMVQEKDNIQLKFILKLSYKSIRSMELLTFLKRFSHTMYIRFMIQNNDNINSDSNYQIQVMNEIKIGLIEISKCI
jgi:hypothetical protein